MFLTPRERFQLIELIKSNVKLNDELITVDGCVSVHILISILSQL